MHHIAVAHLLLTMLGNPITGLATYYETGAVFRNGDSFQLDADVCAVDWRLWDEYKGDTLFVLGDEALLMCVVGDTGNLHDAGTFQRHPRNDDLWIRHGTGPRREVIVDIPRETFIEAFGNDETELVNVWRVE